MGIGKISHYSDGYLYGYNEPQGTRPELADTWDEWMLGTGQWDSGWKAFFGYADGTDRNSLKGQVKPYECADVPDNAYPDGVMADRVIERLRQKTTQPFLMAVGFFRPHLPFNSPKKYWDLYNEDSLPLTPVPGLPEGAGRASLHPSNEFNSYRLGDESASLDWPLSDAYARTIRHAYFASISYVDAQIGRVLDELERQGLDKNTIVIVWGDHGWHLGDMRVWGKHTIFDWALRSALIMRVPGQTPGLDCREVVSTVDLYPTLAELAGLEMPHAGDGRSLMPLIRNADTGSWNGQALSFFNRGVSLRTDRYRLTRYSREQEPLIELYDHRTDPYESRNVARQHPHIVDSLAALGAMSRGRLLHDGILTNKDE
jgi:arylsulfatase A-like enzyme